MRTLLATAFALAATTSGVLAQSTIYGVDVFNGEFYSTNATGFELNYTAINPTLAGNFFGLDFDASATSLHAMTSDLGDIGTIDLVSGLFTNTGFNNLPLGGLTGLSSDPDGTTWWASVYDGTANTELWTGDAVTGVFTLVGIMDAGIHIDISVDANGDIFSHKINDESIYAISGSTGAATLIGPTGFPSNYAQGMDFDWANNTLYATIFDAIVGPPLVILGDFCSIDVTTGVATMLDTTATLGGEYEMTFQAAGVPGFPTFCDPANTNSTGFPGVLTGTAGTGVGSGLRLDASQGPPTQFGYFLVGTSSNPTGIPISQGLLCLGGFGRYNVTGTNFNSIGQFDASGNLQNFAGTSTTGTGYDVPVTVPISGSPQIAVGQTWYFQLWYREAGGNSNFTNGIEVLF